MVRTIYLLAAIMLCTHVSACSKGNGFQEIPSGKQANDTHHQGGEHMEEYRIKITVNDRELTAVLTDNATTRAFVEKLPVTLPMQDLYGREMCYRFPDALPTNNVSVSGYEVGEIVYYPPMHSFVIMYAQNGERFSMQKLGRLETGVELFDGIGNVEVSFALIAEEE